MTDSRPDDSLMAETEINSFRLSDQQTGPPPSVIDRYFKRRYRLDNHSKIGEDQMVLTHSNRVCVVCLAESHPVLKEKKSVTKVSFQGKGWCRTDNKFSGKAKRGAQWLESTSPLCVVTCADGCEYTLTCCIRGQLIEINENLLNHPELLTTKPHGEGYIAVLLPGLKGFEREMQRLKSEEEYRSVLSSRSQEHIKSDDG